MVPEPLSLLATAAGLLGFLVGTVSTTAEAASNLVGCQDKLDVCNLRLSRCLNRLRRWHARWEPATAERKREHWGDDGVPYIDKCLSLIEKDAKWLLRKLQGSDWIDGKSKEDGAKELKHKFEEVLGQLKLPREPKLKSVLSRLLYALYDKKLFNARIQSLEGLIEWLEKEADGRHDDTHGTDENNRNRLVALTRRLWNFSESMTTAWNRRPDHSATWGLFIEPVTEFIEVEDPDKFSISFLHAPSPRGVSRRIVTTYHPDRHDTEPIADKVNIAFMDHSHSREAYAINNSLKENFKVAQALDARERRCALKISELTRAKIAQSFATWAALMWNTPWIQEICCCLILEIRMLNVDQRESKLGERPSALVAAHVSTEGICASRDMSNKPYLLIGILLAEIVLTQSIKVEATGDTVEFVLELDHALLGQPERLCKEREHDAGTFGVAEILSLVESNASPLYRKAVEHCFDMDGLGTTAFPVKEFVSFRRHVLDNLRHHHDAMQDLETMHERKRLLDQLKSEIKPLLEHQRELHQIATSW